MNSFFIPQLGSQIYSMAGMTTQLHLIANEPVRLKDSPQTTVVQGSAA